MTETAELVEETTTEIAEFNEFEANLAEYKARYEGVVYDLTDPKQEKQARSDRHAIGKTIASLDRVHKEVKSPLKAQVDLLDGERKRIKDGLLEVQEGIKSQIAEHEARIEAKEQELLGRVEAIKALAEFEINPNSTQVQANIDLVNAINIDDTFEHYEAEATFAKLKALESLEALLADVTKREEEQAELERLRQEQAEREQKEREERIAAEARAKAEAEAKAAKEAQERAEQEAEEAKKRAVQEAKDAAERERQAKLKAEQDAIEAAERAKKEAEDAARRAKEEAEQAQREKEAREQAEREAREADKKHRGAINSQAVADLVEHSGLTQAQAKKVVTAIAKGEISAVSINY